MSSTFLIHPFDNDQHFKSTDSISPTNIKNKTLSRLFDIPVDLLDDANPSPAFSSIVDEQSMFWAPASKHSELTPAEFDTSTVTHSFANRKRSFVKRRKSVLSSSFTPDDENEDELEAIKNDREATLAALERRSMQPIKEGTSKKKNRGLRRSISLTLPNTTPNYDISDIQGSPVLLFHRGSVLRRGEKSKFRRRSSCNPPSKQSNDMEKEQEQDEQEEEEEEEEEDKESIENQDLSSTTQVSPKDSVIDLCSTEESQLDEEEDSTSNTIVDDPSTKIIDLSLNTEKVEDNYKMPTPPPSPPLAALTSEKKSKKSWSRRLFSTKSKKMHEPMQLGVDEIDHPHVDEIDDGRSHTGSKFNFSSLFSSKKYSGYGSLRKKKSSASFSSSSGLERNSPYSSSTDSLVPPKDFQLANFNYTRLPIHTERAIYRLSHIKLTHPRRPLRDQVMISNLMFWYLSVINQPGCNTNNEIEQPENTLNNNSDPLGNAKNNTTNSMALIKKAYGIPTTGTNKAREFKKRTNKRLRQQSTRSTNSNAMDLIKKSGGGKNLSQRRYTRTSNSSSEESDGDDDDDDMSLTDEEDGFDGMIIIKQEEKRPKKKYSLFKYAKGNTHSNGTSSWLPSFSSPKSPPSRQDEDDIPLAMYKKSRF